MNEGITPNSKKTHVHQPNHSLLLFPSSSSSSFILPHFLSRIPISASLYMYVYMCHLIEVYAFAVISEYSLIILRKLPHNLVRTQGFELRCVGLNTEVANLRPGK